MRANVTEPVVMNLPAQKSDINANAPNGSN